MPRIAVIEKDKCNPVGCGGYLCIRMCPVNRMGKECKVIGPDGKAEVHEEVSTDACSVCVKICPFGAIHMVNLPAELEFPLHKYGRDGFRLYSLPFPVFGKVIGLLGINGIGKSTAIKILAQIVRPNFGKQEEASIQEVIEYFKGTEAHLFFEKVKAAQIRIAYKPQAVDLLPKTASGKVGDLLRKIDSAGKFEKVINELQIGAILDNDIKTISGGELQRVALAATALKNANLHILDEPSTYLDIKQRIRMSQFVKSLSVSESSVVVVEHDLIIMDYMTDIIHVMYGEAGAYGIVSLPKATRNAVNAYLSGMLREENVRFRDHEIKFKPRLPSGMGRKEELAGWSEITKRLDNFILSAEKGSIARKEVVGVLGENGTGKTTFVKILAGVIPPDTGEIGKGIKISYKPQYLSTESTDSVASVLQKAVEKYEIQLIRPLGLKTLLLKSLGELSGGELQRVALAECLSKDADIFLIDEPSAFLDAEQRIITAKIIRDFMETFGKTAVVVDHDLLLIDQVSDRLMIFTGEPARKGVVSGPYSMEEGMNKFLKELNITLRRDPESNRPRINKPDSQMDRKQKSEGKLFYG
ncbi:ribosome biogenesis/translation initiation ATPase RLI [Candidatus Woesearchaeota archaeon]|nr:ribosome biogenesis/translation initiation ATPase RLI [Candidatus Woesearchaeota archaeon]